MFSGDRWWEENPDAPAPAAWWLGVFRRSISLKAATPGLLFVPTLRESSSAVIVSDAPVPKATLLQAEPAPPVAKSLLLSDLAFTSKVSGSVTLAGVLPDQELLAAEITQNTPENRLWERIKLRGQPRSFEEEQLSLARRLAYLLQPPAELLASLFGPLEWHASLFPYQMDGVKALLSRDALLLADDMGLGKTIQAIAALRILALQRRVEAALIVVPASLITQWRKELRTWAPELRISTVHGLAGERFYQWSAPAHVYLTTYETLRSDFTDNPASHPRKRVWDVVILDEAQRIKNREAEASLKCKQLPRKRAWALTGTPLENQLDDLASILEFVSPLHPGEAPIKLMPNATLLERHRTLQLRRKKAEVLTQLPAKIPSHIVLSLLESQSESYKRAEEEGIIRLRAMGEEVRVENVLELILRLKQICNFCPVTGQSAKLEDIRERMLTLTAEGHRALVFSQFTDHDFGVDAIASQLHDFRPLQYTGALASSQRERILQAFKEDPSHKVLVLSLRAGGLGLNLQEASYVFHFDRWWNPAVERQAEDRSHRLGQSSPVHVYKYTCEGTIEERIEEILQRKQSLFDEVVDDVSIDLTSRLSAEELFGLFGLTPSPAAKASGKGSLPMPDFGTMSGAEFEQYVKRLLERRGWNVDTTPVTRDGGVDLIASRAVDMGGEITLYVQCKNYTGPAGVEIVRQLNGVLPKHKPGSRGVVVCPGGFTSDAKLFAKDRGILLWEKQHLFELGLAL